jgi:hypothetical protein
MNDRFVKTVPPPTEKSSSQRDWGAIAESLRERSGSSEPWLRMADEKRSTAAYLYLRNHRSDGAPVAALVDTDEWAYEMYTRDNDRDADTCTIYLRAVKRK